MTMEIDFVTPDLAKASSRLYNPMRFRDDDPLHLLLAFSHDEFRRVDGESRRKLRAPRLAEPRSALEPPFLKLRLPRPSGLPEVEKRQ
jgi:hypothetical protein